MYVARLIPLFSMSRSTPGRGLIGYDMEQSSQHVGCLAAGHAGNPVLITFTRRPATPEQQKSEGRTLSVRFSPAQRWRASTAFCSAATTASAAETAACAAVSPARAPAWFALRATTTISVRTANSMVFSSGTQTLRSS